MAFAGAVPRGAVFAAGAAMQYSLRSLLIAAILGPPLLALAWYGAIIASHNILEVRNYLVLPGLAVAAALILYTTCVPADEERVNVHPVYLTVLCGAQIVALSLFIWIAILAVGWVLIWGDMPPVSDSTLLVVAVGIAASVATVTAGRAVLGLISRTFLWHVVAMTDVLLLMSLPFWMHYVSR